MTAIDPRAIVSPKAKIGDNVRIGPFCTVGDHVVLHDGVVLHSHVVLEGRTSIGAGTQIFPFASIGHPPQDMKYRGEASELLIGEANTIREYVTMNPGTTGGGMVTRVGSGGLFMMSAHVAHDCQIGDRVIMANNATLAGHVIVEDDAIIGGLAAIHQHVRIGRRAMVGGMSGVEHDVVPYSLVMGERARLTGINVVGMKRAGFSRDEIQGLQLVYDTVFADGNTLAERLSELEQRFPSASPARDVLAFLREESARALCKPKAEDDG